MYNIIYYINCLAFLFFLIDQNMHNTITTITTIVLYTLSSLLITFTLFKRNKKLKKQDCINMIIGLFLNAAVLLGYSLGMI